MFSLPHSNRSNTTTVTTTTTAIVTVWEFEKAQLAGITFPSLKKPKKKNLQIGTKLSSNSFTSICNRTYSWSSHHCFRIQTHGNLAQAEIYGFRTHALQGKTASRREITTELSIFFFLVTHHFTGLQHSNCYSSLLFSSSDRPTDDWTKANALLCLYSTAHARKLKLIVFSRSLAGFCACVRDGTRNTIGERYTKMRRISDFCIQIPIPCTMTSI